MKRRWRFIRANRQALVKTQAVALLQSGLQGKDWHAWCVGDGGFSFLSTLWKLNKVTVAQSVSVEYCISRSVLWHWQQNSSTWHLKINSQLKLSPSVWIQLCGTWAQYMNVKCKVYHPTFLILKKNKKLFTNI